jgi:hypothetical protein
LLLLLLLLSLLALVHHLALRERNGLVQDADIADVIGENQNQRRVEIGALLVAQSAMRFDHSPKRIIGFRKIRAGG